MFFYIAYQITGQALGLIQDFSSRKKCHNFNIGIRNLKYILQLIRSILNFNISEISALNFSCQGKNFLAFPDSPAIHMWCYQDRFTVHSGC